MSEEEVKTDAPLKAMLERGDFQLVFDKSQAIIFSEGEKTGEMETELSTIVDLYAEKHIPESERVSFKTGAILGLVLLNERERAKRAKRR